MRRSWLICLLGLLGWARHGGTFVENKGQVYAEARYEVAWGPHRIYLTPTGVVLLLVEGGPLHQAHFNRWGPPLPIKAHFMRISWVGAHPVEPEGREPEPTLYNFFQGRWQGTNARGFKEVWYKNLYSDIDLAFRFTPEGLKWDWHVRRAAALRHIRLRYEGVSVRIQGDRLYMETSIGTFVEKLPLVYLSETGMPLPARYRFEGPLVGYEVESSPSASLIIDPVVVFSTFSGSYSDNWGFTATYDLQGNGFAGGNVNDFVWNDDPIANPQQIRFPVTPGAIQVFFGGGQNYSAALPLFWSTDIALWKTNPTGSTRLWATYLGGSDNEQPHSLVTDPQGNLYILGATRSTDFPVSSAAYQPTSGGGIDVIVSCISSTGNQLLGSTYLGGSGEDGLNSRDFPLYYFYADDGRGEIVVGDTACYIISSTRSADFPITAGAYRTTLSGGMDAVICQLSLDLSRLYASTFLGGSGADAGYSIRLSADGMVYAAGGTNSLNFPTTAGAYQPTYQGGRADGWLAVLSPDLTQLLIGTYWGTSSYDQVFMIDLDRQGLLWGVGHTEGFLSPIGGAYGIAGSKQFVFSMNETLSQVTRLSVWGSPGRSTPNITISAFAADRCGYVYVAGWGGLDLGSGQVYGSTTGLPTTPNANQSVTDGADFYVVAFEPALSGLAYASFWGGPFSQEHVDGGTSRFDNRGIIYQSVCAGCGGFSDFPTTPGSVSQQNRSPNCNNALFKIDFQLGDPVVSALAITPSRGCAPFSPTFQNLSQNGTTFYWDFGNGQTSTAAQPTGIVYTQPGTYIITLVAENLFTCNQRDTLRRNLVVYPSPDATFTYTIGCDGEVNLSPVQLSTGYAYRWHMGDGRTYTTPTVSHTYAQPGTYSVRLVVTTPQGCSDSVEQAITVSATGLQADFRWRGDSCGTSFSFENLSQGAQRYVWIFSSGDTILEENPVYNFGQPGSYEVILIAYDASGCSDTLRQTLQVVQAVQAQFSIDIDYCALTIQLKDSSVGAAAVRWDFGDGRSSTLRNPTHTYAAPGRYTVRLIAVSADSVCRDTLEKEIEIDFESQALAEVVIDTCRQRVRFRSRSRFANTVRWWIAGQPFDADTVEWVAPAEGTYSWLLITNPDRAPFCRDTLEGTFTLPLRVKLDSLLWEGDLCEGQIRFQIPLAIEKILYIEVDGSVYPPTQVLTLPFRYPHTYQWRVIYIGEFGCRDTLFYSLDSERFIQQLLFVPNVFTPNGDGINDVFRIVGSPECIQELAIYDRWGRLIYTTLTAPFVWDGRLGEGEIAPEGAYVYVIRLRGYARAGTVTLLR
ncbi:MAG: PKD domain-containing protein [Bacteroidia bacterium]|nr:PKD domain-containing protein [Bacteroidia bacterium]MDW8015519.1 PKD domain-containing protein [Bacteroidia bacterium]